MSYTSKLVNYHAANGKHNGVKMDKRDLRLLGAWVDLTCPYRGHVEIRALPDPDFAGIEKLPIRPRVKTAPVIDRFNIKQDIVPGRDARPAPETAKAGGESPAGEHHAK